MQKLDCHLIVKDANISWNGHWLKISSINKVEFVKINFRYLSENYHYSNWLEKDMRIQYWYYDFNEIQLKETNNQKPF